MMEFKFEMKDIQHQENEASSFGIYASQTCSLIRRIDPNPQNFQAAQNPSGQFRRARSDLPFRGFKAVEPRFIPVGKHVNASYIKCPSAVIMPE
jgi:hypothetical protein